MKIIIDFHNYGYTILRLSIKNALLLKIAQSYERFFGKKAHYAFCVSKQMQTDLRIAWGIKAIVLYDRPNPHLFKALSL
jgi:beta-1,4-mannosyltransferase